MSNFEENAAKEYESFEEVLSDADCEISASEFQGIMVGLLSAGLDPKDNNWLSMILELVNDGHQLPPAADDKVKKLLVETCRSLQEQDLLSPILIPADDYPLIDRIESLALWCQGYLLGFGLQMGDQKIESAEIKESLHDISEIAQLAVESESAEESQSALVILFEHVKVAVKVIYLELVFKVQQKQFDSINNGTLH